MKNNLKFKILVLAVILSAPLFASASTISRPMHNSGLVGYWSMEEATGDKAYDRSGNGNNGTLTNMNTATSWVRSNTGLGQALNFDGSNDYVDAANNSTLQLSSGTVSVWLKTSGAGSSFRGVVVKQLAYSIFLGGNVCADNVFGLYDWVGGANRCSTAPSVADGLWHHLVLTFQSGVSNGTTFYVDGVAAGVTTMTVSPQTNATACESGVSSRFTMGTNCGAVTGQAFAGSLDEVRVYNRVLSAEEISRLYKIQKAKVASGVNNTGLVGYWPFEEGYSTKTRDVSFNENEGTISGATWVTGKVGGALSFDGSSDVVDVGDAYGSGAPSLSVSLWMKSSQSSGNKTLIGKYDNTVPGSSWMMWSSGTAIIFYTNPGSANLTGVANVFNDVWHHVVVTYNGVTKTIYVDGALDNSVAYSGALNSNTTSVKIGSSVGIGDYLGQIDDVRIYNRVLSASEVKALYNGSKATVLNKTNKTNLRDGLVGYWTFDGKDIYDTTALDSSGNNNKGTLAQGPATVIGKIGQALSFIAATGANVSASFSISAGSAVTVSFWGKWDSALDSDGAHAIDLSDITTERIVPRFGSDDWFIRDAGSDTITGVSLGAINGSWHHYTLVVNGTTAYSYRDGVNIDSDTNASYSTATLSSVCIGGSSSSCGSSSDHYGGYLDDVRIYNRALSADEIKALYNSGR